jgi:putative hydrolase of the HAD superfamily
MTRTAFSHVETWVFDLDNTLYPPETALFGQINIRMTDWVMRVLGLEREAADRLRHRYWRDHGTTLAGLMRHHGVDPGPYLEEVHEIDFTVLTADPALGAAIAALPGRKIVFTNGTRPYAERVIAHRGLDGLFDAVYGVEHAGLIPKPERAAFETVFALDGLDPVRGAMFEDDPRNLAVPHVLGMRTVHVAPAAAPAEFIEHHTADLAAFLGLLGAPTPALGQPVTSPDGAPGPT